MVFKRSKAGEKLFEYRHGWKHGACAAASALPTSREYVRGYRDGSRARALATNEAQERLNVSDDEILQGILR